MTQLQLKFTNGSWCQSRRSIGPRYHCQRPVTSATTIRGQQGWVRYSPLLGLSSAALSNGKYLLFSAFKSKAASFSKFLDLRF